MDDSVHRIFMDPTARHLIVCMKSQESFYLARNSKKPKPLAKMKVLYAWLLQSSKYAYWVSIGNDVSHVLGNSVTTAIQRKKYVIKWATMTEIVCEQGGKVRRAGRFSYPTLSPYRWSHSKPGPSWPFWLTPFDRLQFMPLVITFEWT